jgi:putative glutamine amidotransferase
VFAEPDVTPPPLVGLTASVQTVKHGVWDEDCAFSPMDYVTAVIRAGGAPVILAPQPSPPETVLEPLLGLIVTGGPDVDPSLYGAEPGPHTDPPRKARDEWEMSLIQAALHDDLPLLCICRGLQVLNVTLGGTLHQHLPDVIDSDAHRRAPGQMTSNTMALEAGSSIAAVLGTSAEGLCHHHQGIARLGRRLRAVGFAADGTVEAVEVSGQEFAIGVQWHPEEDPGDDRLFVALVQAARRYRTEMEDTQDRPGR